MPLVGCHGPAHLGLGDSCWNTRMPQSATASPRARGAQGPWGLGGWGLGQFTRDTGLCEGPAGREAGSGRALGPPSCLVPPMSGPRLGGAWGWAAAWLWGSGDANHPPPSPFCGQRQTSWQGCGRVAGARAIPTEPALASLGAAALPGRWGGAAGPLGTARGNGRWCVEGAGRGRAGQRSLDGSRCREHHPAGSILHRCAQPRASGRRGPGVPVDGGKGVGVHVCGVSVGLWRPGEPPRGQGHLTCSCLHSVSGELECQLPVWA